MILMNRGLLIGANIADIHFGAYEPREQYETLKEQFINFLYTIPRLDYIAICGDLFHKKVMGNSDVLYYASLFVEDVVQLSRIRKSTVVIIHGTMSHDSQMIKIFYHYLNDPDLDIKITDSLSFINVKGARALCIPELYDVDESVYDEYLHRSGYYDIAFMHGTFKGAVYGDNVGNGRLFNIHDFDMCTGMIMSGHVHTSGCFNGYFYYCGSPYRWQFGEPEEKGFIMSILDLDSNRHCIDFIPIKCNSYITLDINDNMVKQPKEMIEYINGYKVSSNADYLKVKFNTPINGSDKMVIDSYYRNNPNVFVEFLNFMEEKRIQQEQAGIVEDQYNFILDPNLTDYEKFVRYVNLKEGNDFISVDKLMELLEE